MENRYCIVRCENAGVFAGIVKERNGREVVRKLKPYYEEVNND